MSVAVLVSYLVKDDKRRCFKEHVQPIVMACEILDR